MNVEEIKLLERIERDALITKFGDYETWYRSVGHAYLRQLELFYLKRFVDLSGQEIVVDAGCADGRIAIELAKQAQKIYAIDHSPKSIKVLNDRLEQHPELAKKIEPLVGDISNALFAQESIDRIISIQVLQHVPTESERLNTLSAFYGYLRPRGKLLLSVYRSWEENGSIEVVEGFMPGSEGRIYYHRFTATELRSLLKNAGFEKTKILPMKVAFYFPHFKVHFSNLGKCGVLLDYLAGSFTSPNKFGGYLFAVCEK